LVALRLFRFAEEGAGFEETPYRQLEKCPIVMHSSTMPQIDEEYCFFLLTCMVGYDMLMKSSAQLYSHVFVRDCRCAAPIGEVNRLQKHVIARVQIDILYFCQEAPPCNKVQ